MSGPFGAVLIALTIAVVFVNGWTDAPNAIVSAVATHAISYRGAVRLAAVCNLAGILVMSLLNASVAATVSDAIDLTGVPVPQAAAALCAAMAAIVAFAVAAWSFGIPTSESHALIAALTGASVALGGWGGVSLSAWGKVLAGLAASLACGFLLGSLCAHTLGKPLSRLGSRSLDRLQVAAAGGMAFMHGAQDGQKFIAVFVLADLLAKGLPQPPVLELSGHPLALLLTAAAMALGTSVGGKRIVRAVGEKMVPLQKHQGVCADLASALCLLAASLTGIPMSTTHTKTTAIMGAGSAGSRSALDKGVVSAMFLAWGVTFPACALIGYLLTRLFTSL